MMRGDSPKVLQIHTSGGAMVYPAAPPLPTRKSKSKKSVVRVEKIPVEKAYTFCTETNLTKNFDGNFYVCYSSKISIDKNQEPRRSQKEILGLLSFPDSLLEEVSKVCNPWNEKEAQDNRHLELNRLEDLLLKLAIPFIRIGHLPRGRYFQLKGNLIMVSADLVDSMKKILPLEQNLLPVSLKRKLQYGGHYIKEYIDRPKVKTYLNWFQLHNHLFEDIQYDEKRVDTFEEECMALAAEEDSMKNDLLVNHQEIQLKKEVQDEIFFSDEEEEKEKKDEPKKKSKFELQMEAAMKKKEAGVAAKEEWPATAH